MDRSASLDLSDVSHPPEDTPNPDEVSCNLDNVYNCLKSGLVGDDDVDLGKYLIAYKELYNFFVLLGGAFAFVASDVKTKIQILENYRKDSQGDYESVKKMIDYEIDKNLLENSKFVSGSRTLLRLHRGLDFVQQFLGEVYKLEYSVRVGTVCRETYDKTLANFHPWMIRKTAGVAMRLLPTKEDLLKKITKNDPAKMKNVMTILPDMLHMMRVSYDRVDSLYTLNKLHSLS